VVEGEGVGGRALLAVGGDDGDLAERRERLRQLANAFAVDAVVVGDEDALQLLASLMKLATSFFSLACEARSMYIMCPASK